MAETAIAQLLYMIDAISAAVVAQDELPHLIVSLNLPVYDADNLPVYDGANPHGFGGPAPINYPPSLTHGPFSNLTDYFEQWVAYVAKTYDVDTRRTLGLYALNALDGVYQGAPHDDLVDIATQVDDLVACLWDRLYNEAIPSMRTLLSLTLLL